MANIKVTPEELSQQGADVCGLAQELRDILESVKTKVGEIEASWDGLASEGFMDLYESMQESLAQFPELVDAIGKSATAAAEAFTAVDEELKTNFSQG